MYPTASGKALAACGRRCPCNRSGNPVWTSERADRTLALSTASTGRCPLRREGARTGSARCSTVLARRPQRRIPGCPNAYPALPLCPCPSVTVRATRYGRRSGPTGRWRCRRPAPVDVPCAGRAPGPDRLAVRRCLPDGRNAGYRDARTLTPLSPAPLPRLPMWPMIRRVPRSRCLGVEPPAGQRVSGTATTRLPSAGTRQARAVRSPATAGCRQPSHGSTPRRPPPRARGAQAG